MSKMKILIVEDDHDLIELLMTRLKKRGFEVRSSAGDANIMGVLSEFKPDIVLLDIMMPRVSGLNVLKELRSKYSSTELPVIMMTVRSDDSDIIKSFELGANDYLIKPLKFEVTVARIRMQLGLRQLVRENLQAKELEVVNAMIVTYNHEINNPLSIAKMVLDLGYENLTERNFNIALKNIDRVIELVKKIDEIDLKRVEMRRYAGTGTKMVKLI